MNRSRFPLPLRVALLVAALLLAGAPSAGAAESNPTGPGVLRLEMVGVGFDLGDGQPPPPAAFLVRSVADGATLATRSSSQLASAGGGPCPGVGALCTGDVTLTVASLGSDLNVSVTQGPTDRLAVYSGDCDGAATPQNATSGRVRLAVGQTRVCRVTFVRPDDGGVSDADTGLLVRTTFDVDPSGAARPDQQLDLRGGNASIAGTSMGELRDITDPGERCPLSALRPQCEWAVAFDQDDHPAPFRIEESSQSEWLPIFGGACDARGFLPSGRALGGELVQCSIENVHLESQDGSGRNAAVRVEIVAPAAAGSPTDAAVEVRSFAGDVLADVESFEMLTDAGSPCASIAGALCTGDIGLTVHPSRTSPTERYSIHLVPSPSGYVPQFSGACSTTSPQNALAHGVLELGIGALATCRVTLVPPPPPPPPTTTTTTTAPPPPPPPVLTVGDLQVREGNSGTVAAGVRISVNPASSQPVTVTASTANGTASAPGDFTSVSRTATIPAGQTSVIVPVPIVGDLRGEPDETFTVRLGSPSGATIGDATALVTILNDDDRTPPVIAAKASVVAESKVAPISVPYAAPTANDLVDGPVTVTCLAKSGASFPLGTTTVTCSAKDRNGNAATSRFDVLVRLPTTSGAVTMPGKRWTEPLQVVSQRRRVQVDAGGFAPRSRVELVFITSNGTQIPMAHTRADSTGRIDRVVHVSLLPLGAGQMTALGSAGDGSALVRAWPLTVGTTL